MVHSMLRVPIFLFAWLLPLAAAEEPIRLPITISIIEQESYDCGKEREERAKLVAATDQLIIPVLTPTSTASFRIWPRVLLDGPNDTIMLGSQTDSFYQLSATIEKGTWIAKTGQSISGDLLASGHGYQVWVSSFDAMPKKEKMKAGTTIASVLSLTSGVPPRALVYPSLHGESEHGGVDVSRPLGAHVDPDGTVSVLVTSTKRLASETEKRTWIVTYPVSGDLHIRSVDYPSLQESQFRFKGVLSDGRYVLCGAIKTPIYAVGLDPSRTSVINDPISSFIVIEDRFEVLSAEVVRGGKKASCITVDKTGKIYGRFPILEQEIRGHPLSDGRARSFRTFPVKLLDTIAASKSLALAKGSHGLLVWDTRTGDVIGSLGPNPSSTPVIIEKDGVADVRCVSGSDVLTYSIRIPRVSGTP